MPGAAPTFNDFLSAGKAEASLRRPEVSFREGDVSEMEQAGAATMADHLTGWGSARFNATFLDGASGDDLTTLVDDHWNIQRRAALPAVVELTLTRTNGDGALSGTVPAGTQFATQRASDGTEIRFELDADVNFLAGELSKTVDATATATGTSGNVAAAKVVRILSSLFDSTFSVTNAVRAAGGTEEETDEALRDRVRNFSNTLRRGTADALEFGAKQVAGVTKATCVENASGLVYLYVSDADGNSNGAMTSAVEAEIENWRAAGISVSVFGGALYNAPAGLAISISLTVRAGVDIAALVANVKKAIVSRLAKLRIGETCYRSMIRQAAMNVDPDGILECAVVAPAADVAPAANELIRTSEGAISVA